MYNLSTECYTSLILALRRTRKQSFHDLICIGILPYKEASENFFKITIFRYFYDSIDLLIFLPKPYKIKIGLKMRKKIRL